MIRIRSFRGRMFAALLAVALLPVVVALWAGTLALREIVASAGTAGPWEAVAESGRTLLDGLEEGGERPEVAAAAAEHREALSESVRLSRLYAFVAQRFLELLPLIALGFTLFAAALALLAARLLSRQFARPIGELVGWTQRIARGEPLPTPAGAAGSGADELRALRDALRSMDAELREARRREIEGARLRSWTEMARRVSHELKNPLTPMRMAAVSVARLEDNPVAAGAGEVLLEEIDRLDEMARAFAHFGRLPEGATAPVDLEELLEGLAARHRSDEVPIRVSAEPDLPLVRGHLDALLRVFRNLIVNAVEAVEEARAADAGGREEGGPPDAASAAAGAEPGAIGRDPVTVTLSRAVDAVEVTIRDRGPGIPPELFGDLWTPDFTTKRRGTGLGLSLVKRTVEAYGGSVRAENDPEGGARFTVRLPAEAAEA